MNTKPNDEKMNVFEQMIDGLRDAIAHTRDEINLRTTTLNSNDKKRSRTPNRSKPRR
ncbi:MAG: hypothetical protein KGS45_12385 [Planctomycetes bacterium]|nr:hypothetical protein [Planctomycetota bacterium]